MCGINIIYHADGSQPHINRLRAMNQALHHRGPDENGIHIDKGIGMGHTRLSIVDIDSGQQPMVSKCANLTIVYNGELYNYQKLRQFLIAQGYTFKTHSDTEVLLYLYHFYGPACVQYMRGMFSFAVHNKQTGKLFIARDRLGIKPLFYHWHKNTLVAASEIKALFASGLIDPKLNLASVKNYFTYQFAIAPNTLFESIYELPPGHQMSIHPGSEPKIQQYWDLQFPQQGDYESLDEKFWVDRFEAAMEDAVSSHTIGDVAIGSYLSGGIDSGTITQLLSGSKSDHLKTFSIGFSDPDHDESAIFKQIAQHLNVENKQLHFSLDPEQDFFSILEQCLYHLEQPQRMSVDIPHLLLSRMVRAEHYKLVCTGDGADEILAGYDCFRQDSMRTNSNGLLRRFFRKRTYLKQYSRYFAIEHMQMLLELHAMDRQRDTIAQFGFYPAWYDFWQITNNEIDGIFLTPETHDQADEAQMQLLIEQIQPRIQGLDPLNQSLYFETKTRLPGWILWKSDRLSMANGVEARVPFMDHPLVELSAAIPPQFKLNGMNEKYILKQMMNGRLPEMPHQFKKRGFYTPVKEWFFTPDKREQTEEYFSTAALLETGIFNPQRVRSLYKQLLHMKKPDNMASYYRCLRLEWVLLTVLSVQMLYRLFSSQQRQWKLNQVADNNTQSISIPA